VARNANKFYVLTIRQGTEDFVQSLEAVRDEFAASPVRRHQTAFTVQASFVYSAKPYESLDAMLAALEG
jgi:hypothetical protein